ncbi:MAG: hypothetical protein U0794_12940 [Isosphaeraceae bacterium]
MLEPLVDTFRATMESTLKAQQDLLKTWWLTPAPGNDPKVNPIESVDRMRSFQKQVMGAVVEMFKKHRETLDAQYGLAIQALEEAFRIGDTRDPGVFLKRSEEFYKHGFDCVRAVAEDQMRGLQAASDRWLEVVSKGAKVAAS